MHLKKASGPATDRPVREPQTRSQAGGLDNREATFTKPALQGRSDCRGRL